MKTEDPIIVPQSEHEKVPAVGPDAAAPGLRPAAEILEHPGYPAARARYFADTLDLYGVGGRPGRTTTDAGWTVLLGVLMANAGGYEPENRATWPTAGALKAEVARFALHSPRQVDEIVARLVQTGHVDARRHPADGRVTLLFPTETLLAWQRDWYRCYYRPLHMLFPEPGFDTALRGDPLFQRCLQKVAAQSYEMAHEVMAYDPDVLYFLMRSSALLVLMGLTAQQFAEPDRAFREAEAAFIGRQFGTSRSHVRNLLAAAAERGFIRRAGANDQQFRLTPRWIACLDRFIADALRTSELTYRRAERLFRDRPAAEP